MPFDQETRVRACKASHVEKLDWCSYVLEKPWIALLPLHLPDELLRHIASERPHRGASDCLGTLMLVSRVLCIKLGVESVFELPIPVSAVTSLLELYEQGVLEECQFRDQGKQRVGAIEDFVWFIDRSVWVSNIFRGPTLNSA